MATLFQCDRCKEIEKKETRKDWQSKEDAKQSRLMCRIIIHKVIHETRDETESVSYELCGVCTTAHETFIKNANQ